VKKAVAKKAVKAAPKKAVAKKTAPRKPVKPEGIATASVALDEIEEKEEKKLVLEPVADDAPLPDRIRYAAMKILDEHQAEDILSVDLRGKSPLADYAVISSVKSSRQAAAIAEFLCKAFEEMGVQKTNVEGLPQGDWVLIDTGDVIVHIFRAEVRAYYAIEDIWAKHAEKPVEE
jgi:ribosome-associated protein